MMYQSHFEDTNWPWAAADLVLSFKGNEISSSLQITEITLVMLWSPATVFPSVIVTNLNDLDLRSIVKS